MKVEKIISGTAAHVREPAAVARRIDPAVPLRRAVAAHGQARDVFGWGYRCDTWRFGGSAASGAAKRLRVGLR